MDKTILRLIWNKRVSLDTDSVRKGLTQYPPGLSAFADGNKKASEASGYGLVLVGPEGVLGL